MRASQLRCDADPRLCFASRDVQNAPQHHPRPTWQELAGAFVLFAMIAIIQLIGTRRLEVISHPLWLDETFTARIANDASFTHMIDAVKHGFDTNPPTLYLMYW